MDGGGSVGINFDNALFQNPGTRGLFHIIRNSYVISHTCGI